MIWLALLSAVMPLPALSQVRPQPAYSSCEEALADNACTGTTSFGIGGASMPCPPDGFTVVTDMQSGDACALGSAFESVAGGGCRLPGTSPACANFTVTSEFPFSTVDVSLTLVASGTPDAFDGGSFAGVFVDGVLVTAFNASSDASEVVWAWPVSTSAPQRDRERCPCVAPGIGDVPEPDVARRVALTGGRYTCDYGLPFLVDNVYKSVFNETGKWCSPTAGARPDRATVTLAGQAALVRITLCRDQLRSNEDVLIRGVTLRVRSAASFVRPVCTSTTATANTVTKTSTSSSVTSSASATTAITSAVTAITTATQSDSAAQVVTRFEEDPSTDSDIVALSVGLAVAAVVAVAAVLVVVVLLLRQRKKAAAPSSESRRGQMVYESYNPSLSLPQYQPAPAVYDVARLE
jgi:hypothetical protein